MQKIKMQMDIEKIANHYGVKQFEKAQEEIGELTTALARFKQKTTPKHAANLIEEIADVEIMLTHLKYLFDIEQQVDVVKLQKIERTLKRIKEEQEQGEKSRVKVRYTVRVAK